MALSEIYPQRIRARTMSITFLTLIATMGKAATFFLLRHREHGAWIFALFLAPETKWCSLEQLEKSLSSGHALHA